MHSWSWDGVGPEGGHRHLVSPSLSRGSTSLRVALAPGHSPATSYFRRVSGKQHGLAGHARDTARAALMWAPFDLDNVGHREPTRFSGCTSP